MNSPELSLMLLQADIEMLVAAAARINQRIRSAAATYIGVTVSFGTVIVAAANLVADRSGEDLAALYKANQAYIGVTGCFLYGVGVIQLLSFCRDRKHYVKIISALNDLRRRNCDALKLEGEYASLWTNSKLLAWPGDSATTMTFLALTASTIMVLIGAMCALSLPPAAAVLVGLSALLSQTYFAFTVSE